MYLWLLLISIPLISVILLYFHARNGKRFLDGEQIRQIQNKVKMVIDVRTTTEWNNGHLKDAIHIPVQEISDDNLLIQKIVRWSENNIHPENNCILVYCRSGNRARVATEKIMNYLPRDTCIYYTSLQYNELETLFNTE